MAAQVALARRESHHRGQRHLGLAKAVVTELPHTWRAWRAGRITEWKATLIARETACLSRDDRWRRWTRPSRGTPAVSSGWAIASSSTRAGRRPIGSTPSRTSPVAARGPGPSSRPTPWSTPCSRARAQARAGHGRPRPGDDGRRTLRYGRRPAHVDGYGPDARRPGPRVVVGDVCRRGREDLAQAPLHQPGHRPALAMDSRSRLFRNSLARFVRLRDQNCRTPWCDAPIRHTDHATRRRRGRLDRGGRRTDRASARPATTRSRRPGGERDHHPPRAARSRPRLPTGHVYGSSPPVLVTIRDTHPARPRARDVNASRPVPRRSHVVSLTRPPTGGSVAALLRGLTQGRAS